MKPFAIVIIILGVIIFWIGLWGSQHAVMAMIRGTTSIKPSGLPLNPSGPGVQNPQQAQYTAYTGGAPQSNTQAV